MGKFKKVFLILGLILVVVAILLIPLPEYHQKALCSLPSGGGGIDSSCGREGWYLGNPLLTRIRARFFPSSVQQNNISIPKGVVYKEVVVRELTAHPKNYQNQNIQITGKLVSEGSSAVSAQFYLVDGLNKVKVEAWLPLELNLPPNNSPSERLKMMLDFVGRFLNLKGQIEKSSDGSYVFQVQEARVVTMPPD